MEGNVYNNEDIKQRGESFQVQQQIQDQVCLSPGEIWPRRVGCGFGLLLKKRRHSSGYNHPGGDHTDAAVHRRVSLLLQVRRT